MAYAKKKKAGEASQQVDISTVASVQNDQHSMLVTWVNESDDNTLGSRDLSEKCRNYYDSAQWTAAETAKLSKQKQAATVINRIKPKMDGLMGMERANRTTAKAQPRTPKHAGGALAATEAVRFVLQDNFYEQHRSETWENLLIEGTGGMEVIAVDAGDDKEIRITINHIMWDRIIYDPHSRRKDFSDARYLGQVLWMDYDEAVELFPDGKDVLEAMQAGSSTYDDKPRWMDNTRRRVKIVELYYYKGTDIWYACFTRGGFVKGAPKVSPYVNEEGETEWPYEFASLFVEREGGRYGAARQYLDVQDEINKRRSKALHLMSVRQIAVFKGAVDDVNKLRQELAKPDGVIELNQPMNESFEVLKTNDMAAAQFNLLTEAKMEIDAVGYNAAASGKDQRAISGVALRQRTQASQTELAPMFDVLKHLDIRVYRKVWNRIRQYWKAEKWVRVTDDENNLKFVGLNKPQTQGEVMMAQAQAQMATQKTPPEQMQAMMMQLQQRIAGDSMMQQVVSTENDIANLDVDIIMDDAPDTVTQEVEDFQAMAEMVKSGFPIPPEAVIMSSPLSNKDKIIKMMREQPQIPPELQKKMQGMQEDMEKMQEQASQQIQALTQENQALKQDTQTEQMKVAADAQAEQFKAAERRKQMEDEYALKKELQDQESRLAAAKALDEYNLKCDCANRDHDLEKEMMGKKHEMEKEKMTFEQTARTQDQAHEAETDVMPKIEAGFTKAIGAMADSLKELVDLQKQTLAAISAPKKISLADVVFQRDGDGNATGAAATVTPTQQ